MLLFVWDFVACLSLMVVWGWGRLLLFCIVWCICSIPTFVLVIIGVVCCSLVCISFILFMLLMFFLVWVRRVCRFVFCEILWLRVL